MPDDHLAADHRVPVEAARQRAHAHAVIDAELQRLHALALCRCSCLPALDVGVVGQAADLCQRVIDVTRPVVLRSAGSPLRAAAIPTSWVRQSR